jgi:hypothetical protein
MNAAELFFVAPFGILAAALVIYVCVSWRYWLGHEAEQSIPIAIPQPAQGETPTTKAGPPANDRKRSMIEAFEQIRDIVIKTARLH